MNDETVMDDMDTPEGMGGAFADGLTLIRILLTPAIMFLIIKFWPITSMAALASMLFLIAALTDIFDDYFGGTEFSVYRKFGHLDDVADTILCTGTLAALLFVTQRAGFLAWPFAVPALIIIAREIRFDALRANDANVVDVFNNASPMIWVIGQSALWIGAVFSILSAIKIFTTPLGPIDDE